MNEDFTINGQKMTPKIINSCIRNNTQQCWYEMAAIIVILFGGIQTHGLTVLNDRSNRVAEIT